MYQSDLLCNCDEEQRARQDICHYQASLVQHNQTVDNLICFLPHRQLQYHIHVYLMSVQITGTALEIDVTSVSVWSK